MQTFRVFTGADWSLSFRLRDSAGETVTTYTSDATLTAEAWTGDDQAPAFALTAEWVDATEGTVKLSLDGDDTASVAPALYRVRLSITASGATVAREVFLLDLQAAPGSATAPKTYGTFDQMRTLAPYVAELITSDPSLQSDLAEQRAEARRWIDRQLMSRARRDLETQARLHGPIEAVDQPDLTSGVDTGPFTGPSTVGDMTVEAQLDTYQGYLDDDKLDTSDGTIATIASHYALFLVLAPQIGPSKEGATSYQQMAGFHRARAMGILRGYLARIDVNGDGTDYRVLAP